MSGRVSYPTQSSACPLFAAAPPHTLSFNATIKLQAVRLSIERCTHTTSQPLAARMDIAHRPAQPPTGAAFYPISCSIRASGRPPAHLHRQSDVLTAGARDKKKDLRRRKAPYRRGARGFFNSCRDVSKVPDPVPPPHAHAKHVLGQRCGHCNSGGGCGSTKNAPRTRSRAAPEWPCSQCRQPGTPTPCPKSASMRGSSRMQRPAAAL
jgi:hypothetical protein